MVILTTVSRTPAGWHSITLMSLIRGEGIARVARATCSCACRWRVVAAEHSGAGDGPQKIAAFHGHVQGLWQNFQYSIARNFKIVPETETRRELFYLVRRGTIQRSGAFPVF